MLFSAFGLSSCKKCCTQASPKVYDIAIYGATPSGIIAAVAAKQDGASVLIISPEKYIGGMVTGGLGRTDIGEKRASGGLTAEFFNQVSAKTPKENQTPGRPWDLEGKIALQVFNDWVAANNLEIVKEVNIISLEMVGKRIEKITLSDNSVVVAKTFIDASYEGDLMAKAKISYKVGRESREVYNESGAGFQYGQAKIYTAEDYTQTCTCLGGTSKVHYLHHSQFGADIPAKDSNGKVYWGIRQNVDTTIGKGDNNTQAYNFRVTATNKADLLVPWPKPKNYYPERYELLLKYIQAHSGISFYKLAHFGRLPNGKFDINASGVFTTDYVGGNTDYPDADYEKRKEIWQDHEDYVKGFFYFLANDKNVPEKIRNEVNLWGLCKDEFLENGHWPTQLYVREARRMIGEYVMTQKDIVEENKKPSSVAMGSFSADSHPIQRFIDEKGFVREEGHLLIPTKPYEIPFGSIVPKKSECENLLVTVCMSASHVAYCSIRMEPVYMCLGQAAGTAAAMQARAEKLIAIQDLDIELLRIKLAAKNQVMNWAAPSKK